MLEKASDVPAPHRPGIASPTASIVPSRVLSARLRFANQQSPSIFEYASSYASSISG
jgi:hypothetical protein